MNANVKYKKKLKSFIEKSKELQKSLSMTQDFVQLSLKVMPSSKLSAKNNQRLLLHDCLTIVRCDSTMGLCPDPNH